MDKHEAVAKAYAQSRALNIAEEDSFPDLEELSVYIVGDCFLSGAIQLFAKANCKMARTIKDADLVVFLGGSDINPKLYDEKPCKGTYFHDASDDRDIKAFEEAIEHNVAMFGICRGMQFLHVMAGGKLYQDVKNHTSSHTIIDVTKPGMAPIRASSMHHQMCIEFDECFPIAYAEEKGRGSDYQQYGKTTSWDRHRDLEAAAYFSIGAIAVQGHPEVGGYPEYSAWCMTLIKDYLSEFAHIDHSVKSIVSKIGHNSRTGAYIATEKGKKLLEETGPVEPEAIDEGCC